MAARSKIGGATHGRGHTMKRVIWTDSRGIKHASVIRDHDNESMAAHGMPADPPDVFGLDWNEIAKELHNTMVDRGLFTWADVQTQQNGIAGVLTSVLRPKIIALFRTSPNGGDIKEA